MTDERFFSDLLYRSYMASAITKNECEEACYRLSIPYPPQLFKGNQATYQEPVFQTSEVNHGIHCN